MQARSLHVECRFEAVTETFEFVDTDGDSNRLAMIDDQLQWLVEMDAEWTIVNVGPCKLNKTTLALSCESGGGTLKPEDVDRLMRVAASPTAQVRPPLKWF